MKRRTRMQILTSASPAQLMSSAALFMCVGIFALLVIIDQIKPDALSGIRAGSADVIRPVAELISAPKQVISSSIENIGNFFSTYEENKILKAEKAELLKWQTAATELKIENEQLRELLHTVPESTTHFISARMVSDIGSANSYTALISAGIRDGVKKNQAVISPEGLIGRITEVGFLSSRVLLLSDANSHIPVISEKGRHKAMLTGKSGGLLSLNYVEHGDQFLVGERLVTSGDGGMLPAGIPVAEVTEVDGANINAVPFANAEISTMVTIIDYQF